MRSGQLQVRIAPIPVISGVSRPSPNRTFAGGGAPTVVSRQSSMEPCALGHRATWQARLRARHSGDLRLPGGLRAYVRSVYVRGPHRFGQPPDGRRGSWGAPELNVAVASGRKHHHPTASEVRMPQLEDLMRFAGRLLSLLRVPHAVIRLEAEMVIQAEGKRAYEVAEEQARLCLRVSSASGFRFWSRVAGEIERQVAESTRPRTAGPSHHECARSPSLRPVPAEPRQLRLRWLPRPERP